MFESAGMARLEKISAVLFDAAGTLIELRERVGETYARVAREFGVDLPSGRVDDAFTRILRSARPMVFPEASPEQIPGLERQWWRDVVRGTFAAADQTARFADFDAYFDRLYARYSGARGWRAVGGSRELLAELHRRGIATGVISNFDHRLVQILEELDLARFFDIVVTPASARAAKPDPRIFRVALARLAKRAAESVYVGDDHERDTEGARSAGLRAIDAGGLATLAELPDRLEALDREHPA